MRYLSRHEEVGDLLGHATPSTVQHAAAFAQHSPRVGLTSTVQPQTISGQQPKPEPSSPVTNPTGSASAIAASTPKPDGGPQQLAPVARMVAIRCATNGLFLGRKGTPDIFGSDNWLQAFSSTPVPFELVPDAQNAGLAALRLVETSQFAEIVSPIDDFAWVVRVRDTVPSARNQVRVEEEQYIKFEFAGAYLNYVGDNELRGHGNAPDNNRAAGKISTARFQFERFDPSAAANPPVYCIYLLIFHDMHLPLTERASSLQTVQSHPLVHQPISTQPDISPQPAISLGDDAISPKQVLPEMSTIAAECTHYQLEYGVYPTVTWGTMPLGLQMEWKRLNCDRELVAHEVTVNAVKAQALGTAIQGTESLPKYVLIRCRENNKFVMPSGSDWLTAMGSPDTPVHSLAFEVQVSSGKSP